MTRPKQENTVVVTARLHFSSMGANVSYDQYAYGYPLALALDGVVGDGDRFLVTIKRLPRLDTGPRFPQNPYRLPRKKRK